MELTLREALTLAEPLRRAKVVAGAQGLDNVVRSVNVMEVPEILDWVHPGELLVTTMYPLHDDKAAVESLIPRLARKKLAGLAVTPESYIGQLPNCMVRDADALGFPLIELPPRVSFIDIIQPLTSKILDLQADELRQSQAILRRFLDLVLVGGDYSDIAEVIAEVVGQSVSIVDRFRRVLGNGGELDERAMAFMEESGVGDSYLNQWYKPKCVKEISDHSVRLMRVENGDKTLDHLVCDVEVSSVELGHVIVWGQVSPDVAQRALMAMEHGATVVALKMMETRSISQVEQQFRNEILEGLLSDQPASRENALQLSERLGSNLCAPFSIVIVGPDVASGTLLARGERSEQSSVDSSLHLARRYIRALRAGIAFWRKGPYLVAFFPLQQRELAKTKELLVAQLEKVCARIETENAPHTVSIGISRPAANMEAFRQAYEEARHSFEIGRALGENAGSTVTHYEDLGLFRFVPLSEPRSTVEDFCLDLLGPLLTRDRKSSSQLLETLRIFLQENQNHAQAAKALGVHYNTLRYRLARIKETMGDIFADPQRRLSTEVALHLYPLLFRNPEGAGDAHRQNEAQAGGRGDVS